MQFKGHTVDNQPAAQWQEIHKACSKYKQFVVDVRKYDESAEISLQQMRYWHSMPIRLYAEYTGNSQWKSEQWLKRECGEQWFMCDLKAEETRRGQIMFECCNPQCRDLFILPTKTSGVYVCPNCKTDNIRMFFMLSKTELSINDFNQVLENTWDFMGSIGCNCPPPDPQWRINKNKKEPHGKL